MRVLIRLIGHCLREAWDGVWRYPALSFLAVLSIGVSLYVLGLFLLLVFNLNVLVDSLGHDMQVHVALEGSRFAVDALFLHVRLSPGQKAFHERSGEVQGLFVCLPR